VEEPLEPLDAPAPNARLMELAKISALRSKASPGEPKTGVGCTGDVGSRRAVESVDRAPLWATLPRRDDCLAGVRGFVAAGVTFAAGLRTSVTYEDIENAPGL
jgi:hypothetical protein